MKLIYYKGQNFGDQLNVWLWPKLIPNFFEINNHVAFVGIGTLLNQKRIDSLKTISKKIIFSTGVGYGNIPQNLNTDNSYHIYSVRGPLSAKSLGLSENLAITDGAVLIRKFYQPSSNKKYQFSYIPHHDLAGEGCNLVCQSLGFGYIDPRWPVEKVIDMINNTEVLLTEAMHGAIIADSLRVPWIPIVSNPSILSFKWDDWCQSLSLEYQPVYIKRLHHPRHKSDLLQPLRITRNWTRQKMSEFELKKLAKNSQPYLSSENNINQLTDQLENKLQEIIEDIQKGRFN